jgi:hypothetical protein
MVECGIDILEYVLQISTPIRWRQSVYVDRSHNGGIRSNDKDMVSWIEKVTRYMKRGMHEFCFLSSGKCRLYELVYFTYHDGKRQNLEFKEIVFNYSMRFARTTKDYYGFWFVCKCKH